MLKTTVQAAPSHKPMLMAGAAAALAIAAMGFAGGAHARSDVQFSVGVVLPGAQIGVTNAYPVYSQPVYSQPVYVQPQPVYYPQQKVYAQPQSVYYPQQPVYYQPRPMYQVRQPVYVVPAPVYYRGGHRGHGYGYGRRHHDDDRRGDYRR